MITTGKDLNRPRVGAIIPAAGSGKRFGEQKQFKSLGGRPLIYQTLVPFFNSSMIDEIVVVVPGVMVPRIMREIRSLTPNKSIAVVAGGERRQDSVSNGLKVISTSCELICIHDAARPFITDVMIRETIEECKRNVGAIVAIPVKDTIKQVKGNLIEITLDRDCLWRAQTPQTFRRKELITGLNSSEQDKVTGTDESYFLERIGKNISIVMGSPQNIKITSPEDWVIAEAIWKELHG